jgi:hypothetical protein
VEVQTYGTDGKLDFLNELLDDDRTLFDGIFFNEESNIHHTSFLR